MTTDRMSTNINRPATTIHAAIASLEADADRQRDRWRLARTSWEREIAAREELVRSSQLEYLRLRLKLIEQEGTTR